MLSLRVWLSVTVTFWGLAECVYRLKPLDTLYLPYAHHPDLYGYDQNTTTALAIDDANVIYVVGQHYIHVVSGVSPYFLKHKYHVATGNYELTDVEFCGGFVVVAADNLEDPEDGRVLVYRKYDPVQQSMQLLHSIPVGSLPDMVGLTKDCRTIIACIEGEPYSSGGTLVDPLGGVTLIRFDSTDLSGEYKVKKLDFSGFDAAEYEAKGVRFIYKENGNTFARDLEPEYVTISEDESTAYISLQENNAIATVDISSFEAAKITEIYPLGYVDWSKSQLDASDKDGGIKQKNWGIWGMYQPDTIKYFKVDNKAYILTLNEGDAKDYSSWSEELRGQTFVMNDLVDDDAVSPIFKDDLSVVSSLGRLKFSTASGRSSTSNKFTDFYAFGSRSFSIRSAEDMSLVYDSGDALETSLKTHRADLFNANGNDGNTAVSGTFDTRSDDKGPEPESGAVGVIGMDTVLFIGNERTGTIDIYSVRHDVTNPVFHSINYGGNLTTSDSWEYQYNTRRIGDMDPEDIKFISGRDSPILGQDLLVVTGAVSGTLTVYAVVNEDGPGTADPIEVMTRRLFDMADTNRDEYVDREEHDNFLMKEADLNGDGAVAQSEFEYDWETNKMVNLNDVGKVRVFSALDMDNNNLIEPDDCDKFLDIVCDKDGNGLLTIDEWMREWRELLKGSVDLP